MLLTEWLPSSTSEGFEVPALAGDVNGDGHEDLVVGAPYDEDGQAAEGLVYVHLGSADGIDLSLAPGATLQVDVANASFGASVAAAGDVNADGYDDVVVGALTYANGQVNEGAAYVFLGSAAGLQATPSWSAESNQIGAGFGVVDAAGDVNGDGYDDVVVGAPYLDNGQYLEGAAYAYLGSPTGLGATPAWTREGDMSSALFGSSVAGAGDVNGDDYDDVIVGAPDFDGYRGRAAVYQGSATGLATIASWTAVGPQYGDELAASVDGAGDIDGDGYGDVVVGAPGFGSFGAARVYHGSPLGLQSSFTDLLRPDLEYEFGNAVRGVGDIDGDGYDDVAVGSNGLFFVYAGGARGSALVPSLAGGAPTECWYYYYCGGGTTLAGGADLDGDGYDDLLAGRLWSFLYGGAVAGDVSLYRGAPLHPSIRRWWTIDGERKWSSFGTAVAPAGDVNGDGYADVVVGAPNFHDLDDESLSIGAAFAYHGSSTSLHGAAAWRSFGSEVEYLGEAVASAGDVNDDGYDDVLVGGPSYSGPEDYEGRALLFLGSATGLATVAAWTAERDQARAHFATSLSSAGDVDGDGYDDVIVGAPDYDAGQYGEGGAWVYLGAGTGLDTAATWSVEGAQANARLGASVAQAGDVNGDGYDDVIVGAPDYDAGQADEGRAWVYTGSSTGLGTVPAWTAEADQDSARFGTSVAAAGDVDGDGYDDVLVGAPEYDDALSDEGRACLFYGSAAGPDTVAAWTAGSGIADARMGGVVAGAGDVDGDGFADVLLAATDAEQVSLFRGGAGGLAASAASTRSSLQPGDGFGTAVAGAGDVDGDGHDDVLVGAPDHSSMGAQPLEGQASLFLGDPGVRLGACPGPADLRLGGFTPSGDVALAVATGTGTDPIPSGPCAGTPTGLAMPSLLAAHRVWSGGGRVSHLETLTCGTWVQAVDLTTCIVSNVLAP